MSAYVRRIELEQEQEQLEKYRAKVKKTWRQIAVVIALNLPGPLLIWLGQYLRPYRDLTAISGPLIGIGIICIPASLLSLFAVNSILRWWDRLRVNAAEKSRLIATEKARLEEIAFFHRLENDQEFRQAWEEQMQARVK